MSFIKETPTIINWEQPPNQDPIFVIIGIFLIGWLVLWVYNYWQKK